MKTSGTPNNQSSVLLSPEENDIIFRLLGPRCTTLATSVIQLWSTDSPTHDRWFKRDTGALCFVKDNNRRSYYFRLYSALKKTLLWEHELYNKIEYNTHKPFMHTFAGEDSMIAFNFASDEEASILKNVVNSKIQSKERRREDRRHRASTMNKSGGDGHATLRNKTQNSAPPLPNGVPLKPPPPVTNNAMVFNDNKRIDRRDKNRKLTKADIGEPQDFKHVVHVGWDPEKGFDYDNSDVSLQGFFEMAGVSDKHLRDRDTRTFIYDFINKHGGMDAVKEEVCLDDVPATPPPVPSRSAPVLNSHQRSAPPPPPPPSRNPVLPTPLVPAPDPHILPPRPKQPILQPHSNFTNQTAPPPPPPPPPMMGPVPPPPPPISGMLEQTTSETVSTTTSPRPQINTNPQNELMNAIRSGTTLKKVEVEAKVPGSNAPNSDLLSEIRQGIQLKSVTPNTAPREADPMSQGLAGALSRALADRARAIQSDSDSSELSSDDDNWD